MDPSLLVMAINTDVNCRVAKRAIWGLLIAASDAKRPPRNDASIGVTQIMFFDFLFVKALVASLIGKSGERHTKKGEIFCPWVSIACLQTPRKRSQIGSFSDASGRVYVCLC